MRLDFMMNKSSLSVDIIRYLQLKSYKLQHLEVVVLEPDLWKGRKIFAR